MRTLFAEFTQAVDKKVAAVMADSLEKPLAKSLQRGEDAHFDQVVFWMFIRVKGTEEDATIWDEFAIYCSFLPSLGHLLGVKLVPAISPNQIDIDTYALIQQLCESVTHRTCSSTKGFREVLLQGSPCGGGLSFIGNFMKYSAGRYSGYSVAPWRLQNFVLYCQQKIVCDHMGHPVKMIKIT